MSFRPAALISRRILLSLLIGGTLLVGGTHQLLAQTTRISGKVHEVEGDAVVGLEIIFAPADAGKGKELTTKSRKKGRFTFNNVPPGNYLLRLSDSAYAISSLTYRARNLSGLVVADFEEDSVLEAGLPVITIQPGIKATLNIGVVSGSKAEEIARIEVARVTSVELQELNLLFERQEWKKLISASRQTLERNPDLVGAKYLQAVAYWRSGDRARAETVFRSALPQADEQPGLRAALAAVLIEKAGSPEGKDAERELAREAAGLLEQELKSSPDSMSYLTNLFIAWERAGEPEKAIPALRRILDKDPAHISARLRLADLLLDTQESEQALEVLVAAADTNDVEVMSRLYNIGVERWNEGDMDKLLADMERALDAGFDDPRLRRLKGRALISLGRIPEGLVELRNYLERAPDDPEAEDERALLEALEK